MSLPFLLEQAPRLLQGLWLTLQLLGLALAAGGVLAVAAALAWRSPFLPLRLLVRGYAGFFRGTPLIAQIFLVYYGAGQFSGTLRELGLWGIFREAYWCAVITFALNTGAYSAAILRGALDAIPRGQVEAALSMAMTRWQCFRLVLWPQALRIGLPAYGNETIYMLKGTAVASTITLFDLMGVTRAIYAGSFRFEIYLAAAILYILVTIAITASVRALERRLRLPGQ